MILIIGINMIALILVLCNCFGVGDTQLIVQALAIFYILAFTALACAIANRQRKEREEEDTYGDPPFNDD